jgi:hypothetical protein
MNSRHALPLIAIVMLVGFVACVDAPTKTNASPHNGAVSRQLNANRIGQIADYDDYLEQVALKEPSFAGMYMQGGILTLMLTDTSRRAETVSDVTPEI